MMDASVQVLPLLHNRVDISLCLRLRDVLTVHKVEKIQIFLTQTGDSI
jgi:hypothetical protein